MVFKDEDKEYAKSYPSLSDIFELIAIGEEMKKVISIKIYFLPISVRISTRKNYNRPSNVFFFQLRKIIPLEIELLVKTEYHNYNNIQLHARKLRDELSR